MVLRKDYKLEGSRKKEEMSLSEGINEGRMNSKRKMSRYQSIN
jgi:hypothetical protein